MGRSHYCATPLAALPYHHAPEVRPLGGVPMPSGLSWRAQWVGGVLFTVPWGPNCPLLAYLPPSSYQPDILLEISSDPESIRGVGIWALDLYFPQIDRSPCLHEGVQIGGASRVHHAPELGFPHAFMGPHFSRFRSSRQTASKNSSLVREELVALSWRISMRSSVWLYEETNRNTAPKHPRHR